MFPMRKQPCTVTRVLELAECPPDEIPHDPCDYPHYYDPIYFPSIHETVFQNPKTICSWLSRSMKEHWMRCNSCDKPGVTSCSVSFNADHFTLTCGQKSVSLLVSDIESEGFSYCRVSRKLYSEQAPGGTEQYDFNLTLSNNPCWFYFEDMQYETSLNQLSVPVLSRSVGSICDRSLRLARKSHLVRSLLDDFLRRRTELISMTDDDLKSRVAHLAGTAPTHRLHAAVQYFENVYGAEVASAIRKSGGPTILRGPVRDPLEFSAESPPWFKDTFQDMMRNLQNLSKQPILNSLHGIPPHSRPVYNSRSLRSCSSVLLEHLRRRVAYLMSLNGRQFFDIYFAIIPSGDDDHTQQSHGELIERILDEEYGSVIVSSLVQRSLTKSARQKLHRREEKLQAVLDATDREDDILRSWPQVIEDDVVFECLEDYRRGTVWLPPVVCAVCGLERHNTVEIDIPAVGELPFDFHSLQVSNPFITRSDDFLYGIDGIDGAILDRAGIKKQNPDGIQLNICSECHTGLKKGKVPRLSLANHLYRGTLPDEFKDLSWVEEMVCAIYRNTAHVTRIYQSADPSQPRVFHGNTCAHDMNVVSTASVLPRTPADINGMLSVVFVGPGKFKAECLGPMYRIRKQKVWRFLLWLKANNRLYVNMPLDESIMNLYPENGPLPELEEGVVHDESLDVDRVFADETAGFSEHPAELVRGDSVSGTSEILLEKMGVSDPEGVKLSGRTFTASALKNLVPSSSEVPDLILHRSSAAVPEYKNPDLMPGMFPTLFPLGIGGFEDPARVTKLSFESQANALLDVPDHSFRYHHSYIFVALNIIQRRAAHLQTHFTVKKSKFDVVARELTSVSPTVLQSLADHLEHEGKLGTLSVDEQNAMKLLKQVNMISTRIPGSQASKIFVRNEIRSYFSEFGLPHLYCTFNPSVTHSPVFQVMFGDRSVDLSSRFPRLVPSAERARRIAKDPVAAADFFDFCISCIFKYLFGWDYGARKSTARGGILGHLRAFYGTPELTERGSYHGHFLIWLVGGCNPNEIHRRLNEDPEFQNRFFGFFEDVIHHHLPDVEVSVEKSYEPRAERPPPPPSDATPDEI
jgi:Helitron helicase-like domain at N-terminus